MRPGALAHAVDLVQGDVETHEVLYGVPADGGRPRIARLTAVKTQGKAHLPEDQAVRQAKPPGHHISPGIHRDGQFYSHIPLNEFRNLGWHPRNSRDLSNRW